VSQIVGQRQSLRQILVQSQRPRNGPCDLGDFQRVREACAVMVTLVLQKDLRLVLEPAERRGMDDTVPVTLEFAAGGRRRFRDQTASASRWISSINRTPALSRLEVRRSAIHAYRGG
jgi:hypothetical protein